MYVGVDVWVLMGGTQHVEDLEFVHRDREDGDFLRKSFSRKEDEDAGFSQENWIFRIFWTYAAEMKLVGKPFNGF